MILRTALADLYDHDPDMAANLEEKLIENFIIMSKPPEGVQYVVLNMDGNPGLWYSGTSRTLYRLDGQDGEFLAMEGRERAIMSALIDYSVTQREAGR